jgi:hypothetical protein
LCYTHFFRVPSCYFSDHKSRSLHYYNQEWIIRMSDALIVKYIPRNEQSNSKKLLDAFREEINISDEVKELDLLY